MDDRTELARALIEAHPDMMILEVAHRSGLSEGEILSLLPAPRAVRLDHSQWEALLRELPQFGAVRVLVSSVGATMECQGTFGGFSRTGDYFNVQTADLDLHIRWRNIASAMAVEKPSHLNARPTASLQLFDGAGHAILKVFVLFGAREEGDPARRRTAFESLRARYALGHVG